MKAARGCRPILYALEKRLADWIWESRLNGHIVMCTDIWIRTLNLVKMPKFAAKKPADFVPLVGWYNCFMIWHNLCVRARGLHRLGPGQQMRDDFSNGPGQAGT